ncbi:uncharacterized protein MONOS_4727 [Monocercomonoides exilis]|uniref:uncharacterized protein n=1 Tax=Monocercomonoides exilis TaxID=2049356 RepID=UPI00355A9297|nr:hypothetical protein MONOS_4727 [Monocercomonoides exilis]|eukprot:MONOS_4727.1-p1 / transcript=MONOS_4727.1 / gene=MONOS_4727 / organism=Monocercomonoides_exilis_PA203 / gene_product=unspecified product / transcript_product=unspecified product / location=Mono_scaffold00129:81107-84632(-) / protein_length=1110 / sequence_SO=supercontig / SO=protein_coding / is_pseudo=false
MSDSSVKEEPDHFFVISQWDGRTFRIGLSQSHTCATISVQKIKQRLSTLLHINEEVHNGFILDENSLGSDFGLISGGEILLFKKKIKSSQRHAVNDASISQSIQNRENEFRTSTVNPIKNETINETKPKTPPLTSSKPPLPPSKKKFAESSFSEKERKELSKQIDEAKEELEMLQNLIEEKETLEKEQTARQKEHFDESMENITQKWRREQELIKSRWNEDRITFQEEAQRLMKRSEIDKELEKETEENSEKKEEIYAEGILWNKIHNQCSITPQNVAEELQTYQKRCEYEMSQENVLNEMIELASNQAQCRGTTNQFGLAAVLDDMEQEIINQQEALQAEFERVKELETRTASLLTKEIEEMIRVREEESSIIGRCCTVACEVEAEEGSDGRRDRQRWDFDRYRDEYVCVTLLPTGEIRVETPNFASASDDDFSFSTTQSLSSSMQPESLDAAQSPQIKSFKFHHVLTSCQNFQSTSTAEQHKSSSFSKQIDYFTGASSNDLSFTKPIAQDVFCGRSCCVFSLGSSSLAEKPSRSKSYSSSFSSLKQKPSNSFQPSQEFFSFDNPSQAMKQSYSPSLFETLSLKELNPQGSSDAKSQSSTSIFSSVMSELFRLLCANDRNSCNSATQTGSFVQSSQFPQKSSKQHLASHEAYEGRLDSELSEAKFGEFGMKFQREESAQSKKVQAADRILPLHCSMSVTAGQLFADGMLIDLLNENRKTSDKQNKEEETEDGHQNLKSERKAQPTKEDEQSRKRQQTYSSKEEAETSTEEDNALLPRYISSENELNEIISRALRLKRQNEYLRKQLSEQRDASFASYQNRKTEKLYQQMMKASFADSSNESHFFVQVTIETNNNTTEFFFPSAAKEQWRARSHSAAQQLRNSSTNVDSSISSQSHLLFVDFAPIARNSNIESFVGKDSFLKSKSQLRKESSPSASFEQIYPHILSSVKPIQSASSFSSSMSTTNSPFQRSIQGLHFHKDVARLTMENSPFLTNDGKSLEVLSSALSLIDETARVANSFPPAFHNLNSSPYFSHFLVNQSQSCLSSSISILLSLIRSILKISSNRCLMVVFYSSTSTSSSNTMNVFLTAATFAKALEGEGYNKPKKNKT